MDGTRRIASANREHTAAISGSIPMRISLLLVLKRSVREPYQPENDFRVRCYFRQALLVEGQRHRNKRRYLPYRRKVVEHLALFYEAHTPGQTTLPDEAS